MTENETASEDFVLGRMAGVNPLKTQKMVSKKAIAAQLVKRKVAIQRSQLPRVNHLVSTRLSRGQKVPTPKTAPRGHDCHVPVVMSLSKHSVTHKKRRVHRRHRSTKTITERSRFCFGAGDRWNVTADKTEL